MRLSAAALLLLCCSFAPKDPSTQNPVAFKIKTIVIDAGHGGHDPGARGLVSDEKWVTLAIAKDLRDAIHSKYPAIKIILTRDKDVFVDLDERALIAIRTKANLFISIHCNANFSRLARGSETYAIGIHSNKENLEVAERENSAILLEKNYKIKYQGFDPRRPESYIIFSMMQNHMIKRSFKLAGAIEHELGTNSGRGVKQAGFLVLRKTTMPAVLVETGFITNAIEEKRLSSAGGQRLIAGRIFHGFEKYKEAVE